MIFNDSDDPFRVLPQTKFVSFCTIEIVLFDGGPIARCFKFSLGEVFISGSHLKYISFSISLVPPKIKVCMKFTDALIPQVILDRRQMKIPGSLEPSFFAIKGFHGKLFVEHSISNKNNLLYRYFQGSILEKGNSFAEIFERKRIFLELGVKIS